MAKRKKRVKKAPKKVKSASKVKHAPKRSNTKLCVLSFGLALGLLWAFCVAIMGIAAMADGGKPVISGIYSFVNILGTVYLGYKATGLGILLGIAYAFVDGFVGGVIFSWLYNILRRK